jgi:glycosyltransferase involved in cell wall biosynthesis
MASISPEIGKHLDTERMRKDTRVAWIFPALARTHYWQPVFREFTRLIPHTAIFTGLWGGFADGYEGTFDVHVIKGARTLTFRNNKGREAYKSNFGWAPLSLFKDLAVFRPHVIFTTGFSVWTLWAVLYKLASGSIVVVLWDGCSDHLAFRISWARKLARRLMTIFIDFGVSNTHEGVAYMRDVLGIPDSNLLSHPYQVADLAILDSSASDHSLPERRRPTFLCVGLINARKGWNYLLDAADLLVKQGIDQFSVVFVGAGNQEEELRARISGQGLGHVVHHVGQVSYQKMASCYRAADVLVFPTTEDVWGLALIEAMAFGLPVVCSKYAGAREMVEHEENGFIVDPRNVEVLARYMARFIQDRDLISRFGARSLARIAPFTSARAAEVLAGVALGARQPPKSMVGFNGVEHDQNFVSRLPITTEGSGQV